MTIFSHSSIQG